jgi:hypothetical protein
MALGATCFLVDNRKHAWAFCHQMAPLTGLKRESGFNPELFPQL